MNKKSIKPRNSNPSTTNQTQARTKDEFKHVDNKKHHPKKENNHLGLLAGTLTAGVILTVALIKRKDLEQWLHSLFTHPPSSPKPTQIDSLNNKVNLTLNEKIDAQLLLAEGLFKKLGIKFTKQEKVALLANDKPTEAIWQFAQEKIRTANKRSLEEMAWDLNYRDEADFSRAYGRFDLNLGFGLTLSEDQNTRLANNIDNHKRFGLIRLRKFIYQTNFLGNTLQESNRQFDQIYIKQILEFLSFARNQPLIQAETNGVQEYYQLLRNEAFNNLQQICDDVQAGKTTLTGKKMTTWFSSIEKLKGTIEPTNLDNREAHVNWSNTLRPDIIFSNACRISHPKKIVPRWNLKYEPAELFETLKQQIPNYLEQIKAFNEP